MFRNNDLYDLNSAQKTVEEKAFMLELYTKNLVVLEILKQKGIADDLTIESCEAYVKTLPKIKKAQEALNDSKAKISAYQRDPQQHLRDLFAAKLNGDIE